jgi:shikimate dehydrogenase
VITGATRVAGVIGDPVEHSLSPALHNAGFASLGADWVYVAFRVAAGRAGQALEAMRSLGIGGLSVTMPHKQQVAELVDALDPAAQALRSVNTVVVLPDGRLQGHSTDGAGFVAALLAGGHVVVGRSVAVMGAGAAARSIIDALARQQVERIVVVNRTHDSAVAAAELAGDAGSVGSAADIPSVDIVVNATSVGMGSSVLPFDPALLRSGQVVADIVYHPRQTALLAEAERRGAHPVDGLGMLVHQAALQQQLWVGRMPDIAALASAAERELALRRQ